jgi:hypothetical protein
MSDESIAGSKRPKKPYSKPELKQVLLKAEEAVLGACKNSSKAGPGHFKCNSPSCCNVLGS